HLHVAPSQITPLVSAYLAVIFGYVNALALAVLAGAVGIVTNTANISVYLKLGFAETTNISFFALSICDWLVSASTLVAQITYNEPVSVMRLPSGVPLSEVGIGACYVMYPCLGCSACITAILSIDRCLCIALPFKVKDILTPRRTTSLILTMVVYESIFVTLFFTFPGAPYDAYDPRRAAYFIYSFSAPTFIAFFIVLVSTIILVVKLKQSLAWRKDAAKQPAAAGGSRRSKELKAARCVVAICSIFIICFVPNFVLFIVTLVYPTFALKDPYLGTLLTVMYSFSILFQVMSSAVNIFVYYRMSAKYREGFNALSCRHVK
ncbi:hypothetical protein EGW08_014451, partial [Elysia chlorotica]